MKSVTALILLSSFALSAHAGLNKWVDENGKVHYSDTPPPNASVESVRNVAGKAQESAPADYSSKSYSEREAELKKMRQSKKEDADKAAKQSAREEERKQNCANARESLRALESGSRVATYDENGEKHFLDDAAREQRINDARAAYSANCN